jgi:hypothetical protein
LQLKKLYRSTTPLEANIKDENASEVEDTSRVIFKAEKLKMTKLNKRSGCGDSQIIQS